MLNTLIVSVAFVALTLVSRFPNAVLAPRLSESGSLLVLGLLLSATAAYARKRVVTRTEPQA
jgi:hypothetical protein